MNKDQQGYSIIITVYDQEREIAENLPSFLTQTYEPGYEVIVVDESSTDETTDTLKLIKNDHPHLYTTFLPRPNRLESRPRMAYSIGVKAARHEWVIIANINKKPAAPDILQAIAEATDSETQLILGYIGRKGTRLQPFTDCQDASRLLEKAERKKGKLHDTRRMKYLKGKYDFIVVRKDVAHDALKYFDEHVGRIRRFSLGHAIFWYNLMHRSSTTLLVTE